MHAGNLSIVFRQSLLRGIQLRRSHLSIALAVLQSRPRLAQLGFQAAYACFPGLKAVLGRLHLHRVVSDDRLGILQVGFDYGDVSVLLFQANLGRLQSHHRRLQGAVGFPQAVFDLIAVVFQLDDFRVGVLQLAAQGMHAILRLQQAGRRRPQVSLGILKLRPQVLYFLNGKDTGNKQNNDQDQR